MKSFTPQALMLLLLFIGLNRTAWSTTPAGESPSASVHYAAGLQEGRIGISEGSPVDNPVDNIFHVALEEAPSLHKRVWLVYELEGVADHTAVSRSVNDQLAVGGYLVKERKGWSRQREQIDARWLKEGDNVIRFSVAEDARHSYRIRNLSIEVETGGNASFKPAIILNQPEALTYAKDQLYVKGFLQGLKGGEAVVSIEGQPARVSGGAFEALIDRPLQEGQAPLQFSVEAQFADGTLLCEELVFRQGSPADFVYEMKKEGAYTEQLMHTSFDCALSLQGAGLEVKQGDLKEAARLSITSLREVDIPALDAGMVNVTAYQKAFRFLPHGQLFEQAVKLRLAYDETKIPAGYTAADIKTYYFDEQAHHWVPLPADSLVQEEGVLVSRTTHFTDMINAIIKVPESPEVNAYNSTSMKGIKAANPTAAVNLLGPPQANSTGNASMSYPLKLPAGRNGMQPQLAISYNSGGGNSWLGLGWNLNIPALTVDTRWGVPRFDPDQETETYSLNGEMLSPVAHRGRNEKRNSDGAKQFYPRVEGAFNKIIRHGSSPDTYWWEVTDKSGTRYFYGGRPGSGLEASSVLRQNEGEEAHPNGSQERKKNIAHWALVEVLDLNGNAVRYQYDKVAHPGVMGGSPGYNLYISKITYTEHSTLPGMYAVLFEREQERTDISINARYGFKQVSADRLQKVKVQFNKETIRSYELKYLKGAFGKSLLESITELDSDGIAFNAHTFAYFNEVYENETFTPYPDQEESWVPQDDELQDGLKSKASALSGTASRDFGVGLSLSVGFGIPKFTKANSVGGHFNYSQSTSEGMLSLIDINGDGLPDKVFVDQNGDFFYRLNEAGPGGSSRFSATKVPITGISNFYKAKSKTLSGGLEASASVGIGGDAASVSAFVGTNKSKTKSITSIYFSDVNGDGLPDIVKDGEVYFNRLDPTTGSVEFSQSQEGLLAPILSSGTVSGEIVQVEEAAIEKAIDDNPLHDVVRMWKAPYDGKVTISGEPRLLAPKQENPRADGVRVAIQVEGKERWKTLIKAGDFGSQTISNVSHIKVKKGDRIYFRVGSVFNGSNDQVEWAPVIQYEDKEEEKDANGKLLNRYAAEEDFIISAAQQVSVPLDGSVKFDGVFRKPVTSDDLKLAVVKILEDEKEEVLWEKVYTWEETFEDDISVEEVPELDVDSADVLAFRVYSRTNIDWSAIQWRPRLYYSASADPVNHPVMDEEGNPLVEFFPVAAYDLFSKELSKTKAWELEEELDTVQLVPALGFSKEINGWVFFSAKKTNELLFRQLLKVEAGKLAQADTFTIEVAKGDRLFLEYHIPDTNMVKVFKESKISMIAGGEINSLEAGAHGRLPGKKLFGPMYRNWGHFAYKANRADAFLPIDQNKLKLSEELEKSKELEDKKFDSVEDLEKEEENGNLYDGAKEDFIILLPMAKKQASLEYSSEPVRMVWNGYDEHTYLDGVSMSSARMGDNDVDNLETARGQFVAGKRATNKIMESTSNSFTLGAGIGREEGLGASGSYGKTNGETNVLVDFMDMNGDRYPDIVIPGRVQYSTASGGLEEEMRDIEISYSNHRNTSVTHGGTVSGSFVKTAPNPAAFNIKKMGMSIGSGKNSAGLSGNYGRGTNKVDFSWMDVNGDGLPDRVKENGMVALNLGYTFAPEEDWGFHEIQAGKSDSYGGGVSVSIVNGSISAGIGISTSEDRVDSLLQDINGDGLIDELIFRKGKSIGVRLNKGNGFADEVVWKGAQHIAKSSSTSKSANVAFTADFTVFPGIRLVVNPSTNVGQGVSRELEKFVDVDGDGFPDYVRSGEDKELFVKRSTIGKTNLLKSVQRPMGASFTVDYQRTGNTYQMPNAAWVLSTVKMFDGLAGDGVDTLRSSFVYEEGYYDRHEREFYGFGKVITQTLDEDKKVNTQLVQTFHNENYYNKGLLHTETLLDSKGQSYVEKVNYYKLRNAENGEELPAIRLETDPGRAFPALMHSEQYFYEGNSDAGMDTKISFDYDAYGNINYIHDQGGEGTEDDLTADIVYHPLTEKYILNQPKEIVVKNGDKIYRKREADIYPHTGLVKEIRQYLDEENAAVYNFLYDAFGNLEKVTRPENAEGQRMEVDYVYDEVVHTYVEKVKNSFDYTSEARYDYKFGQLLESTDLNGHKITYTIDKVGRVKTVTGPYEKASGALFTIQFTYHPFDEVPWALTEHYDPSHPENKMETATFVDGLGRVLQTKKDVAIYREGGADKEMMVVSGWQEFDGLGRVVKSWYPTLEEKGETKIKLLNMEKDTEVSLPTENQYDVMGRVLKVILPDKTTSETSYGFGADRDGRKQFLTSSKDANGIITEQFTDARGRVTAVKNAGDIWTSFIYNAMGEQTAAINDLGHTTVSDYDQLGRRKTRLHPDAGLTEYTYDLAGNMTELLTANLREAGAGPVLYTYEYERLTDIIYPQNPENNVQYEYGEAGAPHNRAGRIKYQIDASGAQEFYYGPLGEVVKNVRTIVIPQHDDQTYTTEWSYDTWNRLTGMVYPDGEKLEYSYNVGGLLYSMSGKKKGQEFNYVKQLGYDKFEQRVYLEYGNGTKTTYAYEPERRRLHNMVAKTASGRAMMDNIYKYDKVNNILNLTNNAPIPTSSLMGGSSEYVYKYDDLYRLTDATGSFKGSSHEHRYSLHMDYNTVGGIKSKQQTHERKAAEENEWKEQKKTTYSQSYEYGQEQPNAPTHIGKQAYTYDPNGNQTGWTHDVSGQRRNILWDEENRIRTIYDNGAAFHYTYDASGTRVIKGRSSGQAAYVNNEHKGGSGNMGNYTVYVNPYIVLRSGGYTKHFYIEGQRIVSKLGGGMADASKGQKAGSDKVNYPNKQEQSREGIVRNLKFLGHDGALLTAGNSGKTPPGQIIGEADGGGGKGGGKGGKEGENFQYYYHPDHLGSSSYITDASGEVYQHLEYFAFGETFVEEHSNTHRTPYLYNGKELDEETGLYYYGARFYDPKVSVWLAVDPLAEKFAGWSAYNYTLNNPVRLTDPDGKAPLDIIIKGQNNSSITIKTDLIDVAVDASSFGADFGGNHTLEGRAIVQTGLDIVGAVDPTGIADVINGGMYFENGDYGDALISGFGLIPYAGDAAKIPRIAKGLDRISDAIKTVHGNSKLSQKVQHGYEIFNKKTGEILEYGISGQKRSQAQIAGEGSPRINQKLRIKYGSNSNIGGRVIEPNISGRQNALDWEQGQVNQFNKQYGEPPKGQLRPSPNE